MQENSNYLEYSHLGKDILYECEVRFSIAKTLKLV